MESRRILKEMYTGIGMVCIFFLVLGIFLMRPYYLFALGIAIGFAGACLLVYHMYDTLDKGLNLPPKNARNYITSRSIIRLVMSAILMIIGISINWVTFVGVTIGLLAIKVSALFNPLISKLFNKVEGVDNTLDIETK